MSIQVQISKSKKNNGPSSRHSIYTLVFVANVQSLPSSICGRHTIPHSQRYTVLNLPFVLHHRTAVLKMVLYIFLFWTCRVATALMAWQCFCKPRGICKEGSAFPGSFFSLLSVPLCSMESHKMMWNSSYSHFPPGTASSKVTVCVSTFAMFSAMGSWCSGLWYRSSPLYLTSK